jgi:hypothetical protein
MSYVETVLVCNVFQTVSVHCLEFIYTNEGWCPT